MYTQSHTHPHVVTHTRTHTQTHTLSHSHVYIVTRTHTFSLTVTQYTYSHIHTQSRIHTFTQSHVHTHTVTHTFSHRHTYTLSLTQSHTHNLHRHVHTHSHTHALTHTQSHMYTYTLTHVNVSETVYFPKYLRATKRGEGRNDTIRRPHSVTGSCPDWATPSREVDPCGGKQGPETDDEEHPQQGPRCNLRPCLLCLSKVLLPLTRTVNLTRSLPLRLHSYIFPH